ncbi:hypothetical protein XA68_10152 [Ophiocordyceps unilateralis]|uniref:Helicase C-terminal domain-containing protein n=1 Tax=Ophiocordyceps unilateralis TaxID=268505 RepID=A0A2A9P363_OPHUN|nr:hypothetical protein XA68_10152 [Ophiocordyceps unilateralis]
MQPARHHYIPAGCLPFTRNEADRKKKAWKMLGLVMQRYCDDWTDFRRPPAPETEPPALGRDLPQNLQEAVLTSKCYKTLNLLFQAGWVDLQMRFDPNSFTATIRVYLLPDDTCNQWIDRSNPKHKNKRAQLLRSLDYTKEAWEGQSVPSSAGFLSTSFGDESLLQLFNKIQSPNPEPELIKEAHVQDAMRDLIDSAVSGLTTELYPYQRRSAALMLQKETQPGTSPDPRLTPVMDQTGKPYYLDTVAGTVRVEPVFYDGVSGGILAEEMGAGKTLICLALILATKDFPTKAPDFYACKEPPTRKTVAPLTEMAAQCAVRNAVPWKPYFENWKTQCGLEFSRCIDVLKQYPACYIRSTTEPKSRPNREVRALLTAYSRRSPEPDCVKAKTRTQTIHLSSASIVIAPNNLVAQWKSEIEKHTTGLSLVVLVKNDALPPVDELRDYDIVLFSQSRFERIDLCSFSSVHFKRCIVDEGHKLGNSNLNHQSHLSLALGSLHVSARWIVTGTPSHGLFGVEAAPDQAGQMASETSMEMEKKDIQRLGAMASVYLGARPWARTAEAGDEWARWDNYLLLPKHNPRSYGRWDCLKSTLNSLIIRHRLAVVSELLPPVDEKIVMLDGSYQDRLSLNIFAMMIIFNSVQSERKDRDYFFHPRQRKSLLQMVHNLKQTTFFGGSFFSSEEIATAVETAEQFLVEGKVGISAKDETLLRKAIELGHLAVKNRLRGLSHSFHEIPVLVEEFPGNAGRTWSLDGESGDYVCTSASLLSSVQRIVHNALGEAEKLNTLLNGGLAQKGKNEVEKMATAQQPNAARDGKTTKKAERLAGNTKLGSEGRRKKRSHGLGAVTAKQTFALDSLPAALQATRMVSTASAKLSYLVDSISRHQQQEKMIVFYENESTAWYLASVLDVLQIQYLIYAKGLKTERSRQYIDTFHQDAIFRVLLMDLSQAAFGLDMREASRIYFINPVLNPQVEAQAIGRLRRISQQKPVAVETLVLRDSIDEVILERKKHMSQAEHQQAKSMLDIQPIYNWIKKVKVVQLPDIDDEDKDGASQMAALHMPQPVFGQGSKGKGDDVCVEAAVSARTLRALKRSRDGISRGGEEDDGVSRPARRVRLAAPWP